jgi:ssDNA-binding Zn-finger/Zn-ribbon topoisomerase 1
MRTNLQNPLSSRIPAYYNCPKCEEWVAFESNLSKCTKCGTLLQVDDSPYPKVLQVKYKT